MWEQEKEEEQANESRVSDDGGSERGDRKGPQEAVVRERWGCSALVNMDGDVCCGSKRGGEVW